MHFYRAPRKKGDLDDELEGIDCGVECFCSLKRGEEQQIHSKIGDRDRRQKLLSCEPFVTLCPSLHRTIAKAPRCITFSLSLSCFSCFMLRLKQLRKQHNIIRYVLKILTAREERKNLTPCCENYIGWDLFDVFLSRPCFLLISAVVASSSPEFWFRAFAARLICCTMQYDFCAARVPSFNFIPTFVFAIRLQ